MVVCVNLMDEAKKKHIRIDFDQLFENLGVPVVGASARSRKGLDELMEALAAQVVPGQETSSPPTIRYTKPVEDGHGPCWSRCWRRRLRTG